MALVPHGVQEDVHERAGADEDVQRHAVVEQLHAVRRARPHQEQVTLMKRHLPARQNLRAAARDHIEHFEKGVVVHEQRLIARVLYQGDVAALGEEGFLRLVGGEALRMEHPVLQFGIDFLSLQQRRPARFIRVVIVAVEHLARRPFEQM